MLVQQFKPRPSGPLRYGVEQLGPAGAVLPRDPQLLQRLSGSALIKGSSEVATSDAAGLPFAMVGELRRKLGPIVLLVLLLFMGVGIMNFRVSAEFPW